MEINVNVVIDFKYIYGKEKKKEGNEEQQQKKLKTEHVNIQKISYTTCNKSPLYEITGAGGYDCDIVSISERSDPQSEFMGNFFHASLADFLSVPSNHVKEPTPIMNFQ